VALPVANAGTVRTGDLRGFLAAFCTCVAALASSCMALVAVGSVAPFYDQMRPILEAEPEVATSRADPGLLTGDIEIQHAAFRYSADTPLVLRDLSLRIKPGEFVALVGPSGSGKSTLLRLLLGFEQLDSGAVYFDGQDLAGLDVNVVRRQIGVVLQNGRLMSGDIFTNIIGSSTATLAEAWEAARMAGFAEDIEGMPMGMHTVIADGGGTLSGGPRQRLLIARAIVHRPRIVLFDEATSALDNRTQAIVSASLERLQATRIVVAHRLSTVRNADRLYVLERGALVQSGTYDELMAREGPFAELARRQIV
jgi:ABC-type bacteriocin/lantibiotic exporter with double-glycine peptidase domain